MDLLTLFFIALVVLALVWFTYGKNTEKKEGQGEEESGDLDEVGADISEAA